MHSKHPFVSIIIPVANNVNGLASSLDGLAHQDYPKASYEVIVVDNGSKVSPRCVAARFGAIYIEEHQYLGSPYSARNRGVESSKGDIIVLLDATCRPNVSWLAAGVKAIESGYDLVGGDVVFDVTRHSSSGCIYDALTNIRMREAILQRGVAKTTNLFIRRSVFARIGAFPEGLRSGGDIRWTRRASVSGERLGFSEPAFVTMQARGLRGLAAKQYRVSRGMPAIWREDGTFASNFVKRCVLCFVPPDPRVLARRLASTNYGVPMTRFPQLYLVGCALRWIGGVGVFVGTMRLLKARE